jgi:hypothetical protein
MKTSLHDGCGFCLSGLRVPATLGMLLAALAAAGCAPAEKEPSPEKSTARQAVEGFTGKTAVDAGQRTKETIKAVNETRRESFEEF